MAIPTVWSFCCELKKHFVALCLCVSRTALRLRRCVSKKNRNPIQCNVIALLVNIGCKLRARAVAQFAKTSLQRDRHSQRRCASCSLEIPSWKSRRPIRFQWSMILAFFICTASCCRSWPCRFVDEVEGF